MKFTACYTRSIFSVLLLLPHSVGAQDAVEEFSVWINAFIPNNGLDALYIDEESGDAYLADPSQLWCYGTDKREFSSDRDASSRISQYAKYSILKEEPWIDVIENETEIGETHEWSCGDWSEESCVDTAATNDIEQVTAIRKGAIVKLRYTAAAGNGCSDISQMIGKIDWDLEVAINLNTRKFALTGTIEDFPGIEIWAQYNNESPTMLYACLPSTDASPAQLIGTGDSIETGNLEDRYTCN